MLCKILRQTSEDKITPIYFEQKILASMQSEKTSLLEKIYVKNMSILYTYSDNARCCCNILFNMLNHSFISIWLINIMTKLKRAVLTFMTNENIVNQLVSNAKKTWMTVISINYLDINIWKWKKDITESKIIQYCLNRQQTS